MSNLRKLQASVILKENKGSKIRTSQRIQYKGELHLIDYDVISDDWFLCKVNHTGRWVKYFEIIL